MICRRWRLCILLLLALACNPCIVAADDKIPPDQALLFNAQQASAEGKWDDAIAALESLQQLHPKSPILPDGLVLLAQAYLAQQAVEKAAAIHKTVIERWPKSTHVWQVMLVTCKYQAKTSALKAYQTLDNALRENLLSTADRAKAEKLRFTYNEQAESERFFNRALDTLKTLKPPFTHEQLISASTMLRDILPKLAAEGRFDEAIALFTTIRQYLVEAGNPENALRLLFRDYFNALRGHSAQHYADEIARAVLGLKTAKTIGEAEAISNDAISRYYYEEFRVRKTPFAQVKTLHDEIRANLLRIGASTLAVSDAYFWLSAVANYAQDDLGPEMIDGLTLLKDAADPLLTTRLSELSFQAFRSSFTRKQPEQAQELHKLLSGLCTRHNLPDEKANADTSLACARLLHQRETERDAYLREVVPAVLSYAGAAKTAMPMRSIARVVFSANLYVELFKADRDAEALQVFEGMRAAILRACVGDAAHDSYLIQNISMYLNSYANNDRDGFLKAYASCIGRMAIWKASEMQAMVGISQKACTLLLKAGRAEDAKALHRQLRAALEEAGAAETLLVEERLQYFTALAGDPPVFAGEFQPVLAQVLAARSPADVLPHLSLVYIAYAALSRNSNIDDPLAMHEKLQAIFAQFNRLDDAAKDNAAFNTIACWQGLNELQKRVTAAITEKNLPVARKWLDILTTVSPTSQQATRCQKAYQDAGGK